VTRATSSSKRSRWNAAASTEAAHLQAHCGFISGATTRARGAWPKLPRCRSGNQTGHSRRAYGTFSYRKLTGEMALLPLRPGAIEPLAKRCGISNRGVYMSMPTIRLAAGSALLGLLASAALVAQTPSPPQSTSSPSAASSPSQRDATRSPAAEASPAPGDQPADASTPHQRSAMASHEQAMKTCMDRQARATPDASKSEMTKACNDQMKAQKEHLSKSESAAAKDSNSSPAPR